MYFLDILKVFPKNKYIVFIRILCNQTGTGSGFHRIVFWLVLNPLSVDGLWLFNILLREEELVTHSSPAIKLALWYFIETVFGPVIRWRIVTLQYTAAGRRADQRDREKEEGVVDGAPIHSAVVPLSFLLGTWRGDGESGFPTISSFKYGEEITFSHSEI